MATPLALSIKLTVFLVVLSEHLIAFMIPVYIAYMMQKFMFMEGLNLSEKDRESEIALRVGTIEGLSRLMSFVACLFWGAVSDKIGRKYSLMLVLSGLALTSIGFGTASSYHVAIVWRMVAGLFAGTIPIIKATLRDLSDDSNIAVLYSYFASGYGCSSMVGPIVAGFLSNSVHYGALLVLVSFTLVACYVPYKRPESASAAETKSLFTNKNYITSVGIFCVLALVQFGYRILIALYLKVEPNLKGIGWGSEQKPGAMNAMSGVIIMLFPLYFSPYLSETFGVIRTLLALVIGMVPAIFLISWTYLITNEYLLFPTLVLLNGLCVTFSTVFVSFVSIAVSNSVSSNLAGSAMGICQATVALMRALATASTGVLFGWSLNSGLDFFPFDIHFCFMALILVLGINFLIIKFALDPSVEKRKKKENETQLLEKETKNQ